MKDPRLSNLTELCAPVNQELGAPAHKRLLKMATEAFIFIHLSGIVGLVSEKTKESLGLTAGVRIWDVWPDEAFGFSLREALQFGLSHKWIYKRIKEIDWEIRCAFVSEGPKSDWGVLIQLKDVTEANRNKEALQRVDRLKDLGQMVTTIAHELQNPLGGIRGYGTLLYRDLKEEPHLQEMAGLIVEGAKRLGAQLQAILQYARPLQLQLESVELNRYLRKLIRGVKVDPACPENVKWQVHIPDQPIWAPIDEAALQRALLNLIFNAFQAMPLGGVLTMALLQMEGSCLIEISDTGEGIEESLQKKLFSPFFTTKQQGNGIGLVETKKIVQAHSGTIGIRSQPKKGTTVTIHLQVKR